MDGARRPQQTTSARVCLVTPRAKAVDGWGRYAVELVLALRDRGIEPVLATSERAVDADVADVERHAVLPPVVSRRFETPRSLTTAPALRRILSTCDLVHGIAEPYMPLIALARPLGQPWVQTAHGTWAVRPYTSGASRLFHKLALARVDLLVCQSRFTRNAMAKVARLPAHVVLSGGVRRSRFADSTQARPDRNLPGPVVLSVGNVKARKGTHVTLEAVARARRRIPNLQLVVAGPVDRTSPYAARLIENARALGMADAFHLTGELPFADLVAWYRRADVFMLLPIDDAGSFEGLGLVYLEAGAAGLPAIGTTGSGAEEAIVDGATGLLVPEGDAEAAAAALELVLGDSDMRARMSLAAVQRADEQSWDRLAGELLAQYQALLNRCARVS